MRVKRYMIVSMSESPFNGIQNAPIKLKAVKGTHDSAQTELFRVAENNHRADVVAGMNGGDNLVEDRDHVYYEGIFPGWHVFRKHFFLIEDDKNGD